MLVGAGVAMAATSSGDDEPGTERATATTRRGTTTTTARAATSTTVRVVPTAATYYASFDALCGGERNYGYNPHNGVAFVTVKDGILTVDSLHGYSGFLSIIDTIEAPVGPDGSFSTRTSEFEQWAGVTAVEGEIDAETVTGTLSPVPPATPSTKSEFAQCDGTFSGAVVPDAAGP